MIKFNLPETLKYLLEAFMEIFSPDHDNYPQSKDSGIRN
jgi:hypothetical protein